MTELIVKERNLKNNSCHSQRQILGWLEHCWKEVLQFFFFYVLTKTTRPGIELDRRHSDVPGCCLQSLELGPAQIQGTGRTQAWPWGDVSRASENGRGVYEDSCFHLGT